MEVIANGGYLGNISDTLDALLLIKNIKSFDGVLIDVRKTLDDVLVLSKYDNLNKNTLSNKVISQSKYSDIRKVKYPSHIFKYFIPTLQEFLEKYQSNKKIFIKMYDVDNIYLDLLYDILNKFNYQYFYIIDQEELLKNHRLCQIGDICNNYLFLDKLNNNINLDEDIYIITSNPHIIYKNNTLFDDFFY